jgi:hypothetical protein
LGVLVTLALAFASFAQSPLGIAPAELTATDIGGRLRVFAQPGDYKLQNDVVTAVVRRADGWLTELWTNRARLPTAPQLGITTNIDGLWQMHPVAYDERAQSATPFLARRVALLADAIEVDAVANAGGLTYRALTRFRLDPQSARLSMETTFQVEGGDGPPNIALGDAIRWGNVEYWVQGLPQPQFSYKGPARWIGRRGAGGDLMLSADRAMWLDFKERIRGFQPPIHALYHRGRLPATERFVATRVLAYERLPVAPKVARETATLGVHVTDEGGAPLAAKIRIDRMGRAEPLFPYDGDLDGADRFAWTGNGNFERSLPPGGYRLLVSAGIERDVASFDVQLAAGNPRNVEARLPRVISTPGWVSADLHLHQAPSVDADVSLAARVVSVAAEGVELAVASDHYVVTDLAPTLRALREQGVLTRPLATISGSEVSTLGNRFGHFNVFPLAPADNVVYENTTPWQLFADARKKSPRGVLQVNHPRLGPDLGYFTRYGIDDDTGEIRGAGYDPSFDTLEVYNGDEAHDLNFVRRVLLDWIHLLGRGHRYAATGSSDSHKLAFLDPGLPRTMIRWSGAAQDDSQDVGAPIQATLDALKAGRSIVTSGPMIYASVDGHAPGETARRVGPTARLRVIVRAAPWIDVSTVEVLMGGRALARHMRSVAASRSVERLNETFALPVAAPTFVIVVAEGNRDLPTASRPTRPFAFTNPIWLEP